ncbi:MAG: DUF4159 domain-containing protein [Candidatus Krumholzibacteriia bacterium]
MSDHSVTMGRAIPRSCTAAALSGPPGARFSTRWRLLLVAALAAIAVATAASAASARPPAGAAQPEIRIARLHYGGGGDWYCDPSSLPNWMAEFTRRTGVPTAATEAVVTLDSEDLYRYPLLYVSGHGRIALADAELAVLRRYLEAGGFLYADDNYGMDESFRAMVAQLYPESELAPIGSAHPIYRSFYDLEGLPKIHEHDGEPAQGFGIVRERRVVVFYSYSSDIGDGLEDPDVHGDPPAAREAAARMAVNILMYALNRP